MPPNDQIDSLSLDEHLARLTDVQRMAAQWGDGPLLVLAGPGSGKTRVLACRIARLLRESESKPFRILGLTFTNKAADEMRSRVERLVPGQERRLFLGTFHAFCTDVLRQHGVHLGIQPDFRIYSAQGDLESMLNDAVSSALRHGHPLVDTDRALLPVIQAFKNKLIGPDQVGEQVRDPALRVRLPIVYRAYEDELKSRNALDFSSLIYYACELFRQFPAFAKRYRTVYSYWCIDEFQDTNPAQYALIKSIAGSDFKNIFVVADDDQIIYQWNGASHKRLEELSQDFAPHIIQLPTNFRCPPAVVSLANRLIQHNLLRTADKQALIAGLPAAQSSSSVVRVLRFQTEEDEAPGIASDINKLHDSDIENVAVLARTRKLLEKVKTSVELLGRTAHIAQSRDSFISAPYLWIHGCLRQANRRNDRRNLELVAGSFGQITGLDLDTGELVARAESKHGDLLREWADTVRAVGSAAAKVPATEVLNRLVNGGDYLGFIKFAVGWAETCCAESPNEDAFSGLDDDRRAWASLFSDAIRSNADTTLERFLQEIDLRSKEPPPLPGSLSLMTIHAAKGKEFRHVYLIGLAEDVLPSFQSKKRGSQSPELEEERRNCFVAITRAMVTLTLSFANSYNGWSKEPSRFLKEMDVLRLAAPSTL